MVTRGQFGQDRPKNKARGNYTFWKRIFDIGFSLSVLIFFSPLYLAIALLIYLSSSGSVFYSQERVGKNSQLFTCTKFRTMMVGADQILQDLLDQCPQQKAEFQSSFKLKNDPRITAIGKWLRMTSLDELPQFWHVLTGEMSVVGPRPLVPEELGKYGEAIDQILTVKPGITGLWQVSGRNNIPYVRRVQLDLFYSRHRNLGLDLWIILKTIAVVIFPKGNGAY